MSDFKAGFVAIVGRPNTGKSTLVNALVGTKIVITSHHPNTTRNPIRGIINKENFQMIVVDTPGMHKPKNALGNRLNSMVSENIDSTDAVVICMPANEEIGAGDEYIAKQVKGQMPIFLVVTKVDTVSKSELAAKLGISVGEKANVTATRKAVLELRGQKGMLLNPDDKDSWSAGSFFTNPIISTEVAAQLPQDAPRWPTADGRVKTSAAWLIENSGIHKGDAHGGARVSSKHVLALTNSGDATASDIAELAKSAQRAVYEKFGITLEAEVNLIGITL